MNKETITREEAEKICKQMASVIRKGVLNEIEVIQEKLFSEAPDIKEIFVIWTMAGDSLGHIRQHLDDTVEDISSGRYLPKQAAG